MPLHFLLRLTLAACFALPSSAPYAQSIDIDLRIPSRPLSRDALLAFQAILHNPGEQALILGGQPGFSPSGGLQLLVTDTRGQRRIADVLTGDLPPPGVANAARHLVLPPGSRIAVSATQRVADLFPAPGRYRLQVIYHSPTPAAGRGGVEGIAADSAGSALVDIEVTP